ncbi:MAG: hypothetical protein ACRDTM_12895 [Micromonosporaceae bacterium]
MGTVVVALERGFTGHHVLIRVDDNVVLDATNVTTDPSSGVAGSVAVDTGPRCQVEVSLPELDLVRQRQLDVGQLTYLRVSLSDSEELTLSLVLEGPRYI